MILQLLSSAFFLSLVVFTIPLAFEVGGHNCGLGFSLALALYYTLYGFLRLITPPNSRVRQSLLYVTQVSQWLAIFTLLIWSLNKFSDPESSSSETPTKQLTRGDGLTEWIFGRGGLLESVSLHSWETVLRYSAPIFQIAEGVCTLLVIQGIGQLTRWLVHRGGWENLSMISLLAISAGIFSSASYFLYRITTFPAVDNIDSLLIGSTVTCVVFLCVWSIASGRGTPVDASLIFAYIILCIYQIFTDLHSNSDILTPPVPDQPALPPLPPILMASYTTILAGLQTLPAIILTSFDFIQAAISTITPAVLISLIYRVTVMYTAARIVPATQSMQADGYFSDSPLYDYNEPNRLIPGLTWFSPAILIGVYTSLLMQHFSQSSLDPSIGQPMATGIASTLASNTWRWVNVATTMGLYILATINSI